MFITSIDINYFSNCECENYILMKLSSSFKGMIMVIFISTNLSNWNLVFIALETKDVVLLFVSLILYEAGPLFVSSQSIIAAAAENVE